MDGTKKTPKSYWTYVVKISHCGLHKPWKSRYIPALLMTTGCVVLLLYINFPETSFMPTTENVEPVVLSKKTENEHRNGSSIPNFKVLWYNHPPFINSRRDARNCGFEVCKFKNCQMTFNRINKQPCCYI